MEVDTFDSSTPPPQQPRAATAIGRPLFVYMGLAAIVGLGIYGAWRLQRPARAEATIASIESTVTIDYKGDLFECKTARIGDYDAEGRFLFNTLHRLERFVVTTSAYPQKGKPATLEVIADESIAWIPLARERRPNHFRAAVEDKHFQPTMTLDGRVVDAAGAAVAGAKVLVLATGAEASIWNACRSAETDADGRFTLVVAPEGRYDFAVQSLAGRELDFVEGGLRKPVDLDGRAGALKQDLVVRRE